MELNPYESPAAAGESPSTPPRPTKLAHPQWVILPLLWAAYLIFALQAVQHVPLRVRLASTIMTIGALMVLSGVARGWFHLVVVPLYVLLCLLQFAVWTFPF